MRLAGGHLYTRRLLDFALTEVFYGFRYYELDICAVHKYFCFQITFDVLKHNAQKLLPVTSDIRGTSSLSCISFHISLPSVRQDCYSELTTIVYVVFLSFLQLLFYLYERWQHGNDLQYTQGVCCHEQVGLMYCIDCRLDSTSTRFHSHIILWYFAYDAIPRKSDHLIVLWFSCWSAIEMLIIVVILHVISRNS